MSQLEKRNGREREKLRFQGRMRVGVLHRSFFWGRMDGAMEGATEEDETGDQGAHKNVQEAWLYIRALEILLTRERREKERERKREQLAASNNLETG